MGFKPRVRLCACGCKKRFKELVRGQLYYDRKCRNRAAQARLRERAKAHTELMEASHGA